MSRQGSPEDLSENLGPRARTLHLQGRLWNYSQVQPSTWPLQGWLLNHAQAPPLTCHCHGSLTGRTKAGLPSVLLMAGHCRIWEQSYPWSRFPLLSVRHLTGPNRRAQSGIIERTSSLVCISSRPAFWRQLTLRCCHWR